MFYPLIYILIIKLSYFQVVLQKMWSLDSTVAKKYEAIQKSLTKSLSQGNAVRNAEKLKNDFYFTVFHPIRNFSLEVVKQNKFYLWS